MRSRSFCVIALLLAAGTASARAAGDEKPFLHPLFSDDMVLQRDVAAPVWGWTKPGERVSVNLNGKKAEGIADEHGKWLVRIGPFPAGGPYTMDVTGPKAVTISNVLIGDVWLASGQSNMEMGIHGVNNGKDEIARGVFPQIRLFTVPHKIALEPESTVDSRWHVCRPENLDRSGFSAVAYFFGRQLHQDLKVPIGLVHSSWGGTVAEAWTSAEGLKAVPDFTSAQAELDRAREDQKHGNVSYEKRLDAWWRKNDPGSAGGRNWADPAFDASAWKTMDLPSRIEDSGHPDFDGIVWFRKEFDLPASWAGRDLVLHLGPIDDIDTTFVNGTKVGSKDTWDQPRDYNVPAALLKPGRNVIAVRVLDTGGAGGMYGRPEDMRLERKGGARSEMSLAGPWRYQPAASADKLEASPQRIDSNPNIVTVLYNGMIAPLTPLAIKGAIWYQGESNVGRAVQYRKLLAAMIRDWRSRFSGGGDFPFLIVQLANFLATKPDPGNSTWAELREAQTLVTKDVPKTGLAVAIDIGEAGDIHPKNKQDVGKRLALAALAIAYGKPAEYSGPSFRAMTVERNRIRLSFDHVGGGLVSKEGGALKGFAVAGKDGRYSWADAVIEGNDVVVSSRDVPAPVAVRYAWAENPVCNLYNKEGLPAVPFRTDRRD